MTVKRPWHDTPPDQQQASVSSLQTGRGCVYLSTMHFAQDHNTGNYVIRGYADGEIRINDSTYRESLIISAAELTTDWPPETMADLQPEHFDALLERRPEILVLGTGSRLTFPPAAIIHRIEAAGIGLEVMDTAAACRTFSVLTSEDRNVVAALMMI